MTKTIKALLPSLALAGLGMAFLAAPANAAGEAIHIEHQPWSFAGFLGQYDSQQLQRGFKIYQENCANCHGLNRIYFRNLVQPGGPEFPEEAVKALAASWPNQITDGPDDNGKMFERPAKLSDPIRGPYKNENEARAAQNGAYPPDLSLITKARNTENHAFWPMHFLLMAKDIAVGYQEGGANYLYALLMGYADPPAGVTLADGMSYNKAFPGHQIAMPPPLSADAFIEYEEGAGAKASLEQNARDISAFLAWAADPTLNQRKRIGWQVMLYLLITTVLLYLGKRRIWARIKH